MTRTLLILTLTLSVLGCTLSGPAAKPPVSVDLTGAQALYLQAASGARSIIAPDGAVLMKLLTAGATGPATFEDDLGQPVTVTILRTLQLNDAYLLAELDYGEATLTALVTLATGELRAPPVPVDNWERIRVKAGTAYWVSGGALQRVDLDTLSAVDMSQGDRISGGSLLFLDASDNVHTFYLVNGMIDPANQIRIYHANGDPPDTLGWGSPTAYRLGDASTYEDEATGAVYRVFADTLGLRAIPVTFDADGVYEGASQILDASLTAANTVLAPSAGKRFLGNVAFADEDNVASLTVAAGAITGSTKRALHTYAQPTVYREGKVYTADAAGVNSMDMASGLGGQLIADTGIAALEVVKGQVFYSKDSGTYKYDPILDTTELYSADPAEILAVTE